MRDQLNKPIVQLFCILLGVGVLDYFYPHANMIPWAALFLGAAGFVNSIHRD
jgi:hypothetical protein